MAYLWTWGTGRRLLGLGTGRWIFWASTGGSAGGGYALSWSSFVLAQYLGTGLGGGGGGDRLGNRGPVGAGMESNSPHRVGFPSLFSLSLVLRTEDACKRGWEEESAFCMHILRS